MAWDDPRTRLVLGETAASRLEGLVSATVYQPVLPMTAKRGRAAIRQGPGEDVEQADELIFGEVFDVLVEDGDYAFGQALRAGYVGWVETAALSAIPAEPTHWVSALSTFAFTRPSIKAPPFMRLPLNALIAAVEREGRFVKAQGSGWIVQEHLSPIGLFKEDPAGAALAFLGAPYLWGGRTAAGVDCSGLVQQALYACGLGCPRDSDQQGQLGEPAALGDGYAGLRRNDLVVWPGHIGIMADHAMLLHANAHAMCVSIEPLADAISRVGGAAPVIRRLPRV